MASTTSDTDTYLEQIGRTAGVVWQALSDSGPTSFTKLAKLVGEPRDMVMQAIGWLAREGKISIDDSGRGRTVKLS